MQLEAQISLILVCKGAFSNYVDRILPLTSPTVLTNGVGGLRFEHKLCGRIDGTQF